MREIKAAVIGTGRRPEKPGLSGWAMAYFHGDAYEAAADTRIVACADIRDDNAAAFADRYGIGSIYSDYRIMLQEEKPDIVSITTWPHLHARMICDAIDLGIPAIHCEKPMATSFEDCSRIMNALSRSTTRLTFNHQRRFGLPIQRARELLDSGAIGRVQRFEAYAQNLFDYGVNSLDVVNFLAGDPELEWVFGAIDTREVRTAFGVPTEYAGIASYRYRNGVSGTLFAGGYREGPDQEETNPAYRVVGTEGVLEMNWKRSPSPTLRYVNSEGEHVPAVGDETIHGPMERYIERAVHEAIAGLRENRPTKIDAVYEFRSMQIIFGAYESVRTRRRVDIPFETRDGSIESIVREEVWDV